jgi:hypothetical protein
MFVLGFLSQALDTSSEKVPIAPAILEINVNAKVRSTRAEHDYDDH